MNMLFGNRRCF